MTTLDKVLYYFDVDALHSMRMPIEIPNVGRNDLAHCFAACGFRNGAEVGVEQGQYAEVLCRANSDGHLYCVDAWQAYKGYRDHVGQEKLDGFFTATKDRLSAYQVTFLRQFSVDAARLVPDGSLDFVYVDANHSLLSVVQDLVTWMPKLRAGGIMSGHDYTRRNNPRDNVHVVEAVTAYTQAYKISPWFVLGAKPVINGDTRDRPRSYFWVKA